MSRAAFLLEVLEENLFPVFSTVCRCLRSLAYGPLSLIFKASAEHLQISLISIPFSLVSILVIILGPPG